MNLKEDIVWKILFQSSVLIFISRLAIYQLSIFLLAVKLAISCKQNRRFKTKKKSFTQNCRNFCHIAEISAIWQKFLFFSYPEWNFRHLFPSSFFLSDPHPGYLFIIFKSGDPKNILPKVVLSRIPEWAKFVKFAL